MAQSLGLTGAALLSPALGRSAAAQELPPHPNVVPFFGANQAGIATPAQDRLAFGSFDLKTTRIDDLRFQMTDAEFDASLGEAIDEIYKGSTQKTGAAVGA